MIILQRESRYEVSDPDCVFKVNVYLRNDGEHYVTSANHGKATTGNYRCF